MAPRKPDDLVVNIKVDDSGFSSSFGRNKTVFLLLITSRPAVGPSQPLSQSVQGNPAVHVTSQERGAHPRGPGRSGNNVFFIVTPNIFGSLAYNMLCFTLLSGSYIF